MWAVRAVERGLAEKCQKVKCKRYRHIVEWQKFNSHDFTQEALFNECFVCVCVYVCMGV